MRSLKITSSITNRESPSFARYLHEVSKEDLVTAEEEVALVKRIRQGDMAALEKLTKANLRFVISVAKQYQNQGLSFPDLISEGNLGLIKATERFDETRGFKFISYAVWWIRQAMLQALAEHSRIVRLPQHKVSYLSKINKAFTQLEQEFERDPTTEELADLLQGENSEVLAIMSSGMRKISLDAPLGSDEEQSMLDVMHDPNFKGTDHEISFTESLRYEINTSLEGLSRKHAEVVKLYFGLGGDVSLTLYDISQKMNLSSERVRQIKDEALHRIKQNGRCHLLKDYLCA
jgi:RNA polymerase primary sigma factor